jgi:phosphatidylinositol alpha-1,6-mannosyltransferase
MNPDGDVSTQPRRAAGSVGPSSAHHRSRLAGRAGLAVVARDRGGDGVAYVGRLLARALADLCDDEPNVVYLNPASHASVSVVERARFTWNLLKAEASGESDWWIFNHVGIARAQRFVPKRVRRPYAVFLNGIEAWAPNLSSDRLAALVNARARISISQHTADRVRKAHPRVGVIHPCPLGLLDQEIVVGKPDERLIQSIREKSVMIVGRMSSTERYKGHDELLECWSSIVRNVPDAQLVVVGGGDDASRLKAKAAELGLGNAVLFAGFVTEATLAELWKRIAVFAMPSGGEGFGLVYLEAMRASIPCIGSTADAAREIVVDGETGYLVDRAVSPTIAVAVTRLLKDGELRRKTGDAGRRRYLAEFTYDRYLSRLKPILQDAFQG